MDRRNVFKSNCIHPPYIFIRFMFNFSSWVVPIFKASPLPICSTTSSGIAAVSYTHLDVYKRQGPAFKVLITGGLNVELTGFL